MEATHAGWRIPLFPRKGSTFSGIRMVKTHPASPLLLYRASSMIQEASCSCRRRRVERMNPCRLTPNDRGVEELFACFVRLFSCPNWHSMNTQDCRGRGELHRILTHARLRLFCPRPVTHTHFPSHANSLFITHSSHPKLPFSPPAVTPPCWINPASSSRLAPYPCSESPRKTAGFTARPLVGLIRKGDPSGLAQVDVST